MVRSSNLVNCNKVMVTKQSADEAFAGSPAGIAGWSDPVFIRLWCLTGWLVRIKDSLAFQEFEAELEFLLAWPPGKDDLVGCGDE